MSEGFDSRDKIFDQLKIYLVDLFDIPEEDITMDADLGEDLDLDSIDAVDLMVKVQELTGEKISAEDFKTVRSVSDVVDRVHALVNQQAS